MSKGIKRKTRFRLDDLKYFRLPPSSGFDLDLNGGWLDANVPMLKFRKELVRRLNRMGLETLEEFQEEEGRIYKEMVEARQPVLELRNTDKKAYPLVVNQLSL